MKSYVSPIPQEKTGDEYWYYMDLYIKTFGEMYPNMCRSDEEVIEGIKECLKTGEAYEGDLPLDVYV